MKPWERYSKPSGPWDKYKPKGLDEAQAAVSEAMAGPSLTERAHVITGGLLEGIPIAGPAIRGAADRAGAGIRSMIQGTPFQDELSGVRERSQVLKEAMPGTNIGSQVAGGVAGILPAIVAAPGAFGIGAGSLGARAGISGLTSSAIGGADAAVRSGGDLMQAAKGAVFGGGLGVAAPILAQGAGAIANRVMGRPMPTGADKVLGRALGREGMSVDDVLARTRKLGPAGMPADVGPALTEQAEGLASIPGRAQKVVRSKLAERAAQGSQRVTAATSKALGGKKNVLALADNITAQQKATSKPLYDAAYSKPLPKSDAIQSVLDTPAGKIAWAKAKKLAANERIGINMDAPDVRAVDLTKRSFDDMIDVARRAGRGNEARVLTSLKNDLISAVDDVVPEYAVARNAFAGPAAVKNALDDGGSVFANKIGPDELRQTLNSMSQSEKDAFLQGARGAVADAMGTARSDVNAARAMFEKAYNREKLALLIGDDAAEQMLSGLRAETTFMNTRNQIIGNSRTAPRQAIQKELGQSTMSPGAIKEIMNLRAGDAASIAGSKIGRALNAPGIEARNEALAKMLMDPLELAKAGPRLSRAAGNPKLEAFLRSLIVGGGQRAVGGGGF